MPIITFLQDIFSVVKGPYHHKIGRHTQRFCSQAVKGSANEIQKKVFFVTAICADELLASLIGVDHKRIVGGFSGRVVKRKLAKQQITVALRVYTSALLLLLSGQKKIFLEKTGLQEQKLLQTWCSIFDYSAADRQLFNEVLLPGYEQRGIEGLSVLVGNHFLEQLFDGDEVINAYEKSTLQKIMIEDSNAVIRVLTMNEREAV